MNKTMTVSSMFILTKVSIIAIVFWWSIPKIRMSSCSIKKAFPSLLTILPEMRPDKRLSEVTCTQLEAA